MKSTASILIFLLLSLVAATAGAQTSADSSKIGKVFIITLNDNSQHTGKLISMDSREVVIETQKMGQVSIPKLQIADMREVKAGEMSKDGQVKSSEVFATRYLITTNGLPMEKGSSYIQWNWFGPDIQFAVSDHFSCGVMTTWLAMPIIADAKYSTNLGKDLNLGVGCLLGSGTWAMPGFRLALPFAAITYGNRRNNITCSGGYGKVWDRDTEWGLAGDRALCSVAGMFHLSNKVSVVFDSFIMPGSKNSEKSYIGIYMPGMRFQTSPAAAFQFGYMGISYAGGSTQIPIPMLQWFRML